MSLPFVAVSFFLAAVFGAGLLAARGLGVAGRRSHDSPRGAALDARAWFIAGVCGLLLNHLLVLSGLPLKAAWGTTAALGLCGLVACSSLLRLASPGGIGRLVGLMLILLGAFGVTLMTFSNQIYDWDARAIWFFHARILYFAGGLRADSGWQEPALRFAHMDYPKLVPALAAQVADFAGHWNEHLPKAALGALFCVAASGFLAFLRDGGAIVAAFALLVCVFQSALWNGYMDAHVAVFAFLCAAFFGRFLRRGEREDLASGLAAAFLLPLLKNEGGAVALILLAGAAVSAQARRAFWGMKAYAVFLALPACAWAVLKARWDLRGDLAPTAESLQMGLLRLRDGESLRRIAAAVLTNGEVPRSVALLASALALSWAWRRWGGERSSFFDPAVALAGASAAAYAALLFGIYLFTPHDLHWHVTTSAGRVTGTVAALLLATVTLLASGGKGKKESSAGR